MINLGVNTVLFAGFDLEIAMEQIAWAGYDGVELSAIQGMCEHLDLDEHDSQIADIKGLAERFELELLAMEVASLDEARLAKAFEAASKLAIPIVNVCPGGTSGDEREFERQMEVLQAMAERAESYGVTPVRQGTCGPVHSRHADDPRGDGANRLEGVRRGHGPESYLPRQRRRGPG